MHPLHTFLQLEAMGSFTIPYLGYVDVNLRISQIAKFNSDILLLVIHNSEFGNRVSIQVGAGFIDLVRRLITKKELDRATDTWKQTHICVALAQAKLVRMDFNWKEVKREVTVDETEVIFPLKL